MLEIVFAFLLDVSTLNLQTYEKGIHYYVFGLFPIWSL